MSSKPELLRDTFVLIADHAYYGNSDFYNKNA
jgi:hypothetical protein